MVRNLTGKDLRIYDTSNPISESPEYISRQLRADFSKAPSLHSAINRFIPMLEEYALKDKKRASRYRKVAQQLRGVALEIKSLIKEYE